MWNSNRKSVSFPNSLTILQSVTSRSREFPFPGILQFFWWYRNRNQKYLVPKKVSEPVLKKIGTEKSIGNGLKIIWYRKKSRNWSRKNLVPKKDIGTSLEIFQNICVDLGLGLFPSPGFLHFSFDQTITSPFRPCQTMLHCCTQFTTFVIFWQLVATCDNLWQLLATFGTYESDLPSWPSFLTYLPDLPTWPTYLTFLPDKKIHFFYSDTN